jgi:hypothetical protein
MEVHYINITHVGTPTKSLWPKVKMANGFSIKVLMSLINRGMRIEVRRTKENRGGDDYG